MQTKTNMAQLLIYRASAGSGKTHTLVTWYIQWALHYPDAFKHILAVTFTNRATQEMKQRILAYLYGLATGQDTPLRTTLCQAGWSPDQLQLRSKEILSRMVYQYGDFSVTTIDSFFHKIIQSFAKSLGVPHHFSIEMDEALALQETVTELLAVDDPILQKWIIDFALTKLLSGQTWQVMGNLCQIGKALFDESFKLHANALLAAFQEPNSSSDFVSAIQATLHGFEQKMQKIGQRALEILKEEELAPADFAYGTKGVIGYFLKLASKKDFKPSKRALAGKDNLNSWYSKRLSSKRASADTHIASVVERLLHPLLMEAIDLYQQEGLCYRTAMVDARFSYAFRMIGALLVGLDRYRAKHNLLFISDISALLYQAIQESDTPVLYEKISNQFHHFLIDEFQDLSLFQWVNIQPLLRNSLAQGYSSLLVGDVKQSIYRWRGSNWKLLNHEVESSFQESTLHYLTTNRRSQEAIINFNNHLFSRAANHLVDYLENSLSDQPTGALSYEYAQIRRAYSDVVQQPTAQKGGYIELTFFRSDQIDATGHPIDWQTHAKKELITLIEKLQVSGIAAKDIVVLTRNHSQTDAITHLSNTLPSTAAYRLGSDRGCFLWNHIAIKILIHALYYLHNENDLINSTAWIEAYWQANGNPLAGHHDRFSQVVTSASSIERFLPESFWRQKDFLKNLSVYSCVQRLITCLFQEAHGFDDVVAFFQSMVLHVASTESSSIEAFLIWWEQRGRAIKLPVSHNENIVNVMTIHQSKGLAFKVVIVPFCSWYLDYPPRGGPILWSENHQQARHLPIWPIGYGVDLKETDYARSYYLEQMQIHLDNLNLLYVAFTRAESGLYAMAPFPEQMEGMATIADLIYQSLGIAQTDGLLGKNLPLAVDVEEMSNGTKFCLGY